MSSQLTHFGLILNMAVIENATIAMTYAEQFREQAAHLARQRAASAGWHQFLPGGDDVLKRNVLREIGHASASMKVATEKPTNTDQTAKGLDGAGKRDPKGKKKGRKGGKQDWNDDWRGKQGAKNWTRAYWDTYRQTQQTNQQHHVTQLTDPAPAVPKKGAGK